MTALSDHPLYAIWRKKMQRCWRAYIVIDYKQKHLGLFDSEVDAAVAYNNAAQQFFVDFANLNVITL